MPRSNFDMKNKIARDALVEAARKRDAEYQAERREETGRRGPGGTASADMPRNAHGPPAGGARKTKRRKTKRRKSKRKSKRKRKTRRC